MRKLIIAIIMVMSINAIAQKTSYSISKDSDGGLIFNGPLAFSDLDKESTFTWLKSGKDAYNPDGKVINALSAQLKKFSMVVFLGTWCSDSHELIPQLERVLDMTGYPQSQLTVYGVDREKKTKNGEQKKYGIEYVPTIILYDKDKKEIGRITESVQKSIEADMATMIEKYNTASH